MAKIGDDVMEWQTDHLVQWLEQEGMRDCIEAFRAKRMNGRLLVNLSEHEIKSLHHVSHDSKKKLIKSIEKYKRRKKERMERMFGGGRQAQTVQARKPPSFSLDDNAGSDDEGWDSEEWDSEGSQDASSESEGDYLEPEEDLSKGGSLGRESVSVPTGLVAQLRAGIASSLSRYPEPESTAPESYEDDQDIYDVPPEEEEEEELYDEPSDNSGGAVVVRPQHNKPHKSEEKGEYLRTRGMEADQDMYETPLQEEDFSPEPPSRLPKTNRFVPTKVAQGNKFVPVFDDNENETYDIPDLNDQDDQDDQDDSYEIPGEQATPPPRPPKLGLGNMKQQSKTSLQQKVLPGKPQPSLKGPSIPHQGGHHQGTPGRFQNSKTPSSSSSLTPQGTPFRSQPPPPIQSKPGGRPHEQRKPECPPKKAVPTNVMFSGRQDSPVGRKPLSTPATATSESVAPATCPRPLPRGALLNKIEPPQREEKPPRAATESSSPHSRGGAPLPLPTHRKQASLPTDRPPPPTPARGPAPAPAPTVEATPPNRRNLPSKPEPAPVKEEALPPRPPKKGQTIGNQLPASPMKKGFLSTPPVLSNSSFQREQSSASSIESTSADEPIISLQHLPKAGKRSLPALPPTEAKSPLDIMKEAPWFQGSVDRKAVEINLKKLNKDGSFLVRNSTKNPNEYSMSLYYNHGVRHLRIPHKNKKYVLGDSGIQKFDSIVDLVNYYRQNEVDLMTGGKTKLTVACPIYKS